ncbi:hypothetical protein ABPG75_005819 [Micractinium tetrahymenae]
MKAFAGVVVEGRQRREDKANERKRQLEAAAAATVGAAPRNAKKAAAAPAANKGGGEPSEQAGQAPAPRRLGLRRPGVAATTGSTGRRQQQATMARASSRWQ